MATRKQEKQRVRRLALRELIKEAGSQEVLAGEAGTKAPVISQMLHKHRSITDAMCDRLENARRKPHGWMDRYEDGSAAKPLIAQPQFLDEDLAVVRQLIALPDDMQEAIRAVIASAYAITHPPIGRRAARARAEAVSAKE